MRATLWADGALAGDLSSCDHYMRIGDLELWVLEPGGGEKVGARRALKLAFIMCANNGGDYVTIVVAGFYVICADWRMVALVHNIHCWRLYINRQHLASRLWRWCW